MSRRGSVDMLQLGLPSNLKLKELSVWNPTSARELINLNISCDQLSTINCR